MSLDQKINDAALRWCADHQYDSSKDRGIAFKDGAYFYKKISDAEIQKLESELAKAMSLLREKDKTIIKLCDEIL